MIRPSRVINRHTGEPYLRRWHIIPRNRWFNIYLHHFVGSDDERALHDHPWWSLSFKLKGTLYEYWAMPGALGQYGGFRPVPRITHRAPMFAHRLVVPEGKTAWTLFITGRRVRSWGFWCPQGWKHWRDYEASGGCGERDHD